MFEIAKLPLHQKILIGLTVVAGSFLIVCSVLKLVRKDTLNQMILFYGIGVPLFLLMSDTIIELNKKAVFNIWLTIGVLTFIVSLTTYNNDNFIIRRSSHFNPNSGINGLIGNYSTSSLKALLIFLIVYWILNKLLNRKGLFLVNTFMQKKWYHDVAQRKITGLDVLANLILYATVFAAGLFGH